MTSQEKKKAIAEWDKLNRPLGEKLGYPKCCIDAFCKQPPQLMRGKPSKDDKRRFKAGHVNNIFTGFIPCAEHAKMITMGKITLVSLIDTKQRGSEFGEFPSAFEEFKIDKLV